MTCVCGNQRTKLNVENEAITRMASLRTYFSETRHGLSTSSLHQFSIVEQRFVWDTLDHFDDDSLDFSRYAERQNALLETAGQDLSLLEKVAQRRGLEVGEVMRMVKSLHPGKPARSRVQHLQENGR
jgi:hypothetical protein